MPVPANLAELIDGAKCFTCLSDSQHDEVQTYLIAQALAQALDGTVTAAEWVRRAKCMRCLSPATLLEVKAYLVSIIGGLSTDPGDILNLSKCVDCVPLGFLPALQSYILSTDALSPSHDYQELSRLATDARWCCYSRSTLLEVQVYLLAAIVSRTHPEITTDPNVLAQAAARFQAIPQTTMLVVITEGLREIEGDGGGGILGCQDVPADLIPTITGIYAADNHLTDITLDFPKECCIQAAYRIYESDYEDGTSPVLLAQGGLPAQFLGQPYTVTIPSPAYSRFFIYAVQVCEGLTESAKSNILQTYDGRVAAEGWADRVQANGGAAPSSNTINAAERFYGRLGAAGLLTKMIAVNLVVPDSLIAARTPLIVGGGNDPWTEVAGSTWDLAMDGLSPTAAGSGLKTGIVPSAAFNSQNDGGLSGYVTERMGASNMAIMGSTSGGDDYCVLWCPNFTAGFNRFAFPGNAAGNSHVDWARAEYQIGFHSASRVGAADSRYYYESPYSAFGQVGASLAAYAGPVLSTQEIEAIGYNNNTVYGVHSITKTRYSFFAIHDGLTSTQTQALCNAVKEYRRMLGGGTFDELTAGAGAGATMATAYDARVQKQGGAALSTTTKNALATFWDALVTGAIHTKMLVINAVVPDNLTAARTPFFHGVGFTIWDNNGFAAADLTVNGLIGNGSSKYLDTHIYPAGQILAAFSGGMSIYNYTFANENTNEFGGYANATQDIFAIRINLDVAFFAYGYVGTGSQCSAALANFAGFLSGSRTANNAMALYKASSSVAFATADTDAVGVADRRINQLFNIRAFTCTPGLAGYTSKRCSFFAIHTGLSSGESQTLYNAVQALRVALGGGYA